MDSCLFCKIIKGDIPCSKVYEDEYVLCFKDINPVCKVHVLVIPKLHIKDLNEVSENNIKYLNSIMLNIPKIARSLDIEKDGYRVISNTGVNGGQEVPHLHFHILGGEKLGSKIV